MEVSSCFENIIVSRCVMVGEGTHLLRLEQAMHHPPRFKMVTPPGQAQLPGRETRP